MPCGKVKKGLRNISSGKRIMGKIVKLITSSLLEPWNLLALFFFQLSVNKYNIRYAHYIGDSDTGSFKKVLESKPYGNDLMPCKLEGVGHAQKRLGTRFRKLRDDMKGKKLGDGKGILGKGRLTDKIINKMQNYCGMAISQNTLSSQNNDKEKALYSMKKSVLATLWHCTDMPDNQERHALS